MGFTLMGLTLMGLTPGVYKHQIVIECGPARDHRSGQAFLNFLPFHATMLLFGPRIEVGQEQVCIGV
jgi:hypothetical protein